MTTHLKKLAAGCKTIEALYERQFSRIFDYDGDKAVPIWTRRKPTRDGEILEGGSLYWIMSGAIAARQTVLGLEKITDEEDGTYCLIMVSADIVRTVPEKHRPFQGWRYLEPAKAPADRGLFVPGDNDALDEIPEEMEADLRESGLL
jgi:hypothetical protein